MTTLIIKIKTTMCYTRALQPPFFFTELSLAALKVHTLEEVSSILTSSLLLYLDYFKFRLYALIRIYIHGIEYGKITLVF